MRSRLWFAVTHQLFLASMALVLGTGLICNNLIFFGIVFNFIGSNIIGACIYNDYERKHHAQ